MFEDARKVDNASELICEEKKCMYLLERNMVEYTLTIVVNHYVTAITSFRKAMLERINNNK